MRDTNSRAVTYVAPVLPADVIAIAEILEKAGLLENLLTRGVLTPQIGKLLAKSTITESFSRRPTSPVPAERIQAFWSADVVYYMSRAFGRSRLEATDVSFAYLDRIAGRRLTSATTTALAREDCCAQVFVRAKELGVTTIYQLQTAYWSLVRELMASELMKFPDICSAAIDSNEFADLRMQRKTNELTKADYVLCPSSFVYNSLPQDRQNSYKVISLAANAPAGAMCGARRAVFMYAGNITMRKGVHRLLKAWKELRAHRTHELRLIGEMYLSRNFLSDFGGTFIHVPRISRAELNQHYAEASVFVFNPIADGFGQVILEAMSHGVPVIASKNCGAPDVIEHEREGCLIDYGSDEQLCAALDDALTFPAKWAEMGQAALNRARHQTWSNFGEKLLQWLSLIGVFEGMRAE